MILAGLEGGRLGGGVGAEPDVNFAVHPVEAYKGWRKNGHAGLL